MFFFVQKYRKEMKWERKGEGARMGEWERKGEGGKKKEGGRKGEGAGGRGGDEKNVSTVDGLLFFFIIVR